MKVMVIEDDELFSSEIKELLQMKKFEVLCVHDGEEAISYIDKQKFDFYIIDIFVPNISGLDILKFIRQVDIISPVIIMTASSEINNLILAFEYGCNEYLKKPFDFKELEVRMNKLLDKDLDYVRFSDTFLYLKGSKKFLYKGEVLNFRKKEKRFLEILIFNINKTVSSEMITDYVWENDIRESYSLRQLVNGIRKKLPMDIIQTDIGVGYSIVNKK